MPGVVAVFTGKDMAQGGVNPLPCGWLLPDIKIPEYPRGRHGQGQLRGRTRWRS